MYKNRYIIIGSQRSGTTLVHLLLKGHPNIAALNDELAISPFFTKGINTFTYGNDLPEEKEKGWSKLFDTITSITANENTNTVGAKIAVSSTGRAKELVAAIQQHFKDLKIILIEREDLVAQYGSALSGQRSGIMHSWYKGFENREIKSITVNKWLFTRYVLRSLQTYQVLRILKKTHDLIECTYEEINKNTNKQYEEILNFFDLKCVPPTWLNSKKVMPPPEQYIKNYQPMLNYLQYLRKVYKEKKMPASLDLYSKVYSRLYKVMSINRILK